MSLPPGFIDDLRGRVSLAQLAGRKLVWDRKSNPARGDYWAPCPFHQEKSASFHVDDTKGYYYCFGCHAKGDAVSFLRETENLGFLEAVEALAQIAGVPMPARDPAAQARAAAQMGLVEAMEAAVQFYRMSLNGARAAEARAYLDRRGLAPATRDTFEIGFAPDARTALLEHLSGKGFARDLLVEAGLVGVGQEGGAYDRFRGRVMFPIRDGRGRAIAFGARALRDSQQPKYLNSPETPLFDKGRSLFNIGPARAAAGKAGTVIVVEGYMDTIALAQVGIGHAVAPLGTAITEAQLRLIWQIAPEPVIALDGDGAGLRAAQRLVDLALPLIEAGKSLRFVVLPPGQDPDDVVRGGGARAMEALIAGSASMLDLIWSRETEGAVLDSPERRAALDARLRALLDRIADPSLKAHYQAEIRSRRAALFAPPRRAGARPWQRRDPGRKGMAPDGRATDSTRSSLLARPAEGPAAEARIRESAILYGCLNHPELAILFEDRIERLRFYCPDLGEIRDALLFVLARHLNDGADTHPLREAVSARLGRDALAELVSQGQVRANPHLGPEAAMGQAEVAIREELTRHAAALGWMEEVRDAVEEIGAATDEALTWRLRHAAEAVHRAEALPLSQGSMDAEAEEDLSAHLQRLIDQQAWKKPRKP